MECKLTPWTQSAPPTIGWWNTRLALAPLEQMQPQRRWWDGEYWSLMVVPGLDDVHEAEACRMTRSPASPFRFAWQGLSAPPEGGYQYDLNPDGRTALARRANQPPPKPGRVKLLER